MYAGLFFVLFHLYIFIVGNNNHKFNSQKTNNTYSIFYLHQKLFQH